MMLVDEIKTLKQNSDYRLSDVINKCGHRWHHSGRQVLIKNKYNNSILQRYLKRNGLNKRKNFYTLLNIIEEHNQEKTLPVPTNNEIVVHLRLGDIIVCKSEHYRFLNKNYIKLIDDILIKNKNIDKITFVTCFAYQEWSVDSLHLRKPDQPFLWKYTEETQQRNISEVTKLFQEVINYFPALEVKVYSNEDIDKDLCYCVFAEHFIWDTGGFSKLCHKLNMLRKDIKQSQCATQ